MENLNNDIIYIEKLVKNGELKIEEINKYIHDNYENLEIQKDLIEIFEKEKNILQNNIHLILKSIYNKIINQHNNSYKETISLLKKDYSYYEKIFKDIYFLIKKIKIYWFNYFIEDYYIDIENDINFQLEVIKFKFHSKIIELLYNNNNLSFIIWKEDLIKIIIDLNDYYYKYYFKENNNLKIKINDILNKYNKDIEELKFTTRHLIVWCFDNFRYYLKTDLFNYFKNYEYFKDFNEDDKSKFFKSCIKNYDKKLILKKEEININLEFEYPESIYLIRRNFDKKFGILVNFEKNIYILIKLENKIYIYDFKYFSNDWKIFKKIENKDDIIFKYYYDKFLFFEEKYNDIEFELIPLNTLCHILEDFIFSNNNINMCLKRLEINKNFNTNYSLLKNIPFLGATIYTVLEFYDYKKIITSGNIPIKTKINETISTIGKFSIFFSLVITGGIIGQTLIPIPVVGGLIGSLIGGLGSDFIEKKIDRNKVKFKIKFISLIKVIRKSKMKGFWNINNIKKYKNEISYIYEISKSSNFSEDVWLTVICFLLLSLYEDIKLKYLLKNNKLNGNFLITYENQCLNLFEDVIEFLGEKFNILDNLAYIYKFLDIFKTFIKNKNIIYNEKEIEKISDEIF